VSESENAELALDIEFENEWEATRNWNDDNCEGSDGRERVMLPAFEATREGQGQAPKAGHCIASSLQTRRLDT